VDQDADSRCSYRGIYKFSRDANTGMTLLDRVLSAEHHDVLDRADAFATETLAPRSQKIENSREFPRDVVEGTADSAVTSSRTAWRSNGSPRRTARSPRPSRVTPSRRSRY
jgi:hypothetical protein